MLLCTKKKVFCCGCLQQVSYVLPVMRKLQFVDFLNLYSVLDTFVQTKYVEHRSLSNTFEIVKGEIYAELFFSNKMEAHIKLQANELTCENYDVNEGNRNIYCKCTPV